MRFIEIQPGRAISTAKITYYEDFAGRTRIFVDSGQMYEVNIPFSDFHALLIRENEQTQRSLDQLTRYQTRPTP